MKHIKLKITVPVSVEIVVRSENDVLSETLMHNPSAIINKHISESLFRDYAEGVLFDHSAPIISATETAEDQNSYDIEKIIKKKQDNIKKNKKGEIEKKVYNQFRQDILFDIAEEEKRREDVG